MNEKIETFAKLLEKQQIDRLHKDGLNCQTNIDNCKTSIKFGKKYTRVDVGDSGKYMIDNDDQIFGVKGYGRIHHGHFYGTLDTIEQYYWGSYTGTKIR